MPLPLPYGRADCGSKVARNEELLVRWDGEPNGRQLALDLIDGTDDVGSR